jgi:hypothetical protein
MPLSAEQVYNELSGEEVKEILLIRCADLLNKVAEFQSHLTLPRVKMSIRIGLEVWGRTPPTIEINDTLTVRMSDESIAQSNIDFSGEPVNEELEANISADTADESGQPPDEIRVEHGLPVLEPRRTPMGIQDVPVVREEGIKYAFNVTQDNGPMRNRTGTEGPAIGAEVIAQKGQGKSEVGPGFEQVRNPRYRDKYRPGDVNYKA